LLSKQTCVLIQNPSSDTTKRLPKQSVCFPRLLGDATQPSERWQSETNCKEASLIHSYISGANK